MHQCRLSMTTSGVVKSTTTSAAASETLNSQSPSSTIATSSRSSLALTARQTSVPIRPRAPSTPTLIGSTTSLTRVNLSQPGSSQHRREVVIVERPDNRQRHRSYEQLRGDPPDCFRAHLVHPREYVVHREQLVVEHSPLARAAHPRAGVLQPEHDGALEHALAPLDLFLGDPVAGHAGELLAGQRQHLVDLARLASRVHPEKAGVGVLGCVGIHRVGEAALLADLLEEQAGHAATEHVVERAEGETVLVLARVAGAAEHHVGLLGVLVPHDHLAAAHRYPFAGRTAR